MIAPARQPVLVIGGGVSGTAAAIRLRHHGFDVTLMERATFPREKICGCCLGAAGVNALDAIGLGDAVRDRGITTRRFVGYLQTNRVSQQSETQQSDEIHCAEPVSFPIVPGVAISRRVLDSLLIDAADSAGVIVRQPHEAQVVSSDQRSVVVRHRECGLKGKPSGPWTTAQYGLVVVATGLTGVFQGTVNHQTSRWDLPWVDPPHGPLGASTHLPGDHPLAKNWPLENGDIQMICGDDGYVGLVRLPVQQNDARNTTGAIDMAAALVAKRKQKPWQRIARLLRSHPDLRTGLDSSLDSSLEAWLEHDATWMTAPQLRRTREVGRDRVVAIGDAIRYVEPLTGEGMTWGIESGLSVADLWNENHRLDNIDFASLWERKLNSIQPKRRALCGGVTGALRHRTIRRLAQTGLRHGAWLVRPLVRGLANGPHFATTAVPTTR